MAAGTVHGRPFSLDVLTVPVVQAPMAGGPSTPRLAAAVSTSGGLGFLAAGYKSADAVRAEILATRSLTGAPFGVNVFVPQPSVADSTAIADYAESLRADAAALTTTLGPARYDDDDWANKIDLLLDLAPDVVSFTFDIPESGVMEALTTAGIAVVLTVTSRAEAYRAVESGARALCVQGPEAGGHRGTFDPTSEPEATPLLQLIEELRDVPVPLIAAGGVVTGEDTRVVLSRGAAAVQAGTAFLRADEAGTKTAHRAALISGEFTSTSVTKAFSGRYARGLTNGFMRDHDHDAPFGYPEVHHLTTPLRAAAAAVGDAHRLNLWAGTNFGRTMTGSAEAILASLRP